MSAQQIHCVKITQMLNMCKNDAKNLDGRD